MTMPSLLAVVGASPYAAALSAVVLAVFVVYPIVAYFRDPKGIRIYIDAQLEQK